jgi:hypothetical protein
MSDLPGVIDALGSAIAQVIENAQLRPLNDGAVLFGRQFVDDTRAPNSIVFVPTGGTFGPPKATADPSGSATPARRLARPLWTESTDFDVHVWGAATPSVFADDFRVTQRLYQCVLVACFQLATTQVKPGRFAWVSQSAQAPQRDALGQYVVFQLTLSSVVTDLGVNFAPAGTHIVPTLNSLTNTP